MSYANFYRDAIASKNDKKVKSEIVDNWGLKRQIPTDKLIDQNQKSQKKRVPPLILCLSI